MLYSADPSQPDVSVEVDWTESAATYTVYAGESFRLFFSAGDSGKVLTEADLIAFAEAIRIEAKG